MSNVKDIFEIKLEEYCRPRYESAVCSYYGTREEIEGLMQRLGSMDGTKTRYRETIQAVEYYDLDEDLTHTVAGQAFPILTSVQEICRYHTTLENQRWEFTAHDGEKFQCYASRIDVCQILLANDEQYDRCIRASFTGLLIYRRGVGWLNPGGVMAGFPGMVTWDGEKHTVSLFASQMTYDPSDLYDALNDTVNVNMISLATAVADIIGEG